MRLALPALAAAAALSAGILLAPTAAAGPAAPRTAVAGAAAGSVINHAGARPATAPVDVGTDHIADIAQVGADTPEGQQSIDELRAAHGIGLYLVFVDSFDGVEKSAWAHDAFTASDLGDHDILVAVAVQDRRIGGWVGVSVPLSAAVIGDAVNTYAAPHLSNGQWAEAVVATAKAINVEIDAMTSGSEPVGGQAGGAGDLGGSAGDLGGSAGSGGGVGAVAGNPGGSGLGWIWWVLALALGTGIFLWIRRRGQTRKDAQPAEQTGPPPEPYEQLSERSVTALIDTDNAVRASESELALAEAEFGAEATAEFTAALNAAKGRLTEAFARRQEIDDEIPESEQTRRDWMAEILDKCQQASTALEEYSEKFDQLRDLKVRLSEVLAELPTQIDTQAGRLPASASALERITASYSAAAVAAVADNTDHAADRLTFARKALAQAAAGATEPDTGPAVLSARAAQEALAQATTLQDAIERLDASLADAAAKLGGAQDAVAAELAEVRAALAGQSAGDRTAAISGQLDEVTAALAASRTVDAARDPISTLATLREADRRLDDIAAATRSAQQREARDRQAAERELAGARTAVATAADYISTRRGAMAATARTRIAEAQRHLAQAEHLKGSDAHGALAEAQRASELARQAYAEAQDDMDRWSGGWGGGGRGGSPMGSFGGAILGGIIGGMLSGGSSRGGGWGGGGGGFGGGGFGGGGGGGFGGGFGGGGGGGGGFGGSF